MSRRRYVPSFFLISKKIDNIIKSYSFFESQEIKIEESMIEFVDYI